MIDPLCRPKEKKSNLLKMRNTPLGRPKEKKRTERAKLTNA